MLQPARQTRADSACWCALPSQTLAKWKRETNLTLLVAPLSHRPLRPAPTCLFAQITCTISHAITEHVCFSSDTTWSADVSAAKPNGLPSRDASVKDGQDLIRILVKIRWQLVWHWRGLFTDKKLRFLMKRPPQREIVQRIWSTHEKDEMENDAAPAAISREK